MKAEYLPLLGKYALRSDPDRGEILAANIRVKTARKVSIKLNCPLNFEFFCKIHVKLPKMSDFCAVILSVFLLFSYTFQL